MKLEELIDGLWEEYEVQLKLGIPTFFNFTESSIIKIAMKVGDYFSREVARDAYFTLVNSLVEFNGTKIKIKDKVFQDYDGGYSAVIVLISVQILAVEKMANKGGYTPEAYFPPLRRLFSEVIGDDENLPFYQDEFDELWNKFSEEVERFSGTSKTITFKPSESKSRAYKNKIFPLSQGLLNQEDLLKLSILAYELRDSYNLDLDSEWSRFLIEKSSKVSKRGSRLLFNSTLRDGLINQMKEFLVQFDYGSALSMFEDIERSKTSFIAFFEENESLINDNFSYYVDFSDENGMKLDEEVGLDRLKLFINNKNYLTVFRNQGVYTGDPKKKDTFNINNIAFVCFEKNVAKYLEVILRIDNICLESVDVEDIEGLKFYYVVDERCSDTFVKVVNGVITVPVKAELISFEGGIKFDERGNFFLVNYPPNKILLNGISLQLEEPLRCNNNIITVEKLLEKFKKTDEQIFDIEVSGVHSKISFRKTPKKNVSNFGYLIKSNSLSLLASELRDEDTSMVGLNFNNLYSLLNISKADFISFFIREQTFFEDINDKQLYRLLEAVSASDNIGTTHKRFIYSFLSKTRKAPTPMVRRLEVA